ncbi:MAG: hypothetical protein HFI49_00120 [Bacilli bacterium]|jgi:hypothetical protein|nr:hypothetical protein [Bacilli bacterium]
MKGIIYKTNPLIEKTRPEMPFLASDGTECYSLEEVDIINRDILASSVMKDITQELPDLKDMYRLLISCNVKMVEYKIIYETFKKIKAKGQLTPELVSEFEQALLTANVIWVTEQDLETYYQIKEEIQSRNNEPTSGGRK